MLSAPPGVPVVLAAAGVTGRDVGRKPNAPDRHEPEHEQLAPVVAGGAQGRVQRGLQDEEGALEDVDDAGVLQPKAEEPEERTHRQQRAQGHEWHARPPDLVDHRRDTRTGGLRISDRRRIPRRA